MGNESEIILNHFAGRKGTICDIGAGDGTSGSISAPLIELGWEALLVEASYQSMPLLATKYGKNPSVRIVNARVDADESMGFLNICTDPALTTGSQRLVDRARGREVSASIIMKSVTIDYLWIELTPFDALSIDIEDLTLQALFGMRHAKPLVICAEYFAYEVFGEDEPKRILEILGPRGYRELARTQENMILVRE